MSRYLLVLKFLLVVPVLLDAGAAAAGPHVLIFPADDAGWGGYSHSGNTKVHTPYIDSTANSGVSLEHFFLWSVCAPLFPSPCGHPMIPGNPVMDLDLRRLSLTLRS